MRRTYRVYIPEDEAILREVIEAFDFPYTITEAERYGSGHINDTCCVVCQPEEGQLVRFILQGMSLADRGHWLHSLPVYHK